MIFKIDTPCIGVCSTVYGDKICRGCKRRFDEVIDWNGYTFEQKQEIYTRLDLHLQEVVGKYLVIDNAELLKQTLDQGAIRYRDDQHPLSWAFFVLRAGSDKIKNLAEIGVGIRPEYQDLTLLELYNTIDREVYQLSGG